MSTKKHAAHPHLTGEHKWGDKGQLILMFLFLSVWITDSFIFHFSTFLLEIIPDYLRIAVAGIVLVSGWYLARNGMKSVFGTERSEPKVISTGAFSIVRHPIYTGAILFYLGATIITMSIASAAFWILIIIFYILIARYEERILTEEFGEEYLNYKKKTGLLFPKITLTKR
jgi:protein-S-isoprenylcysteine O-methyltransferase Ste14